MSEDVSPEPGAGRGCLITWCVVALALLGLALVLARSSAAQPQSGSAADFTLSTYDGQSISLSQLRGQVVVVNFWASWCDHCVEEAAVFEQGWQAYRNQHVSFIGVWCDDTDAAARKFIEAYGITYPNGADVDGRISDAYLVQGLPQTFFIDRQGKIAFVAMGPLSYQQLSAEIEKLLGS